MKRSPFLTSIEQYMRVRNYSKRTIDTYLYWIKYFIIFSDKQHPENLGSQDIEAFLSYLAIERTVSPSTQAIVLNALVFLKTKFLDQTLAPLTHYQKATRGAKSI